MDSKEGHLEIVGVSKIYDPAGANVLAVDNCSFEIQAGEFVAIGRPVRVRQDDLVEHDGRL